MNYTCATEGCGETIWWEEGFWTHARNEDGSYYSDCGVHCHGKGDESPGVAAIDESLLNLFAHPAGGTNTTPPEELDRDVKVTMDDIKKLAAEEFRKFHGRWCDTYDLIQSYADQAVEESTADLREQLDRALVPKFKVGDRVIYEGKEDVVLIDPYFMYSLKDSAGSKLEKFLAPLETETPVCPLDHRQNDMRTSGFRPWEFCPLCGESLTKEGEA